eukprot:scaffold1655_cov247-Pinguiococcus_pyrenoidosus.AAC.7
MCSSPGTSAPTSSQAPKRSSLSTSPWSRLSSGTSARAVLFSRRELMSSTEASSFHFFWKWLMNFRCARCRSASGAGRRPSAGSTPAAVSPSRATCRPSPAVGSACAFLRIYSAVSSLACSESSHDQCGGACRPLPALRSWTGAAETAPPAWRRPGRVGSSACASRAARQAAPAARNWPSSGVWATCYDEKAGKRGTDSGGKWRVLQTSETSSEAFQKYFET